MKIIFILFVWITLLIFGCNAHTESIKNCDFIYTDDIQNDIVLPKAKEVLKDAYKYYNYEKPTVLYEGKEIWLLMSPIKSINGRRLMGEDAFVIVLERCTNKYIDYFVQPTN